MTPGAPRSAGRLDLPILVPVSRRYDLTISAIARIDITARNLLKPDFPEPRSAAWTTERIDAVVDALAAMRWFLTTGLEPPPANEIEHLREEWQLEWPPRI